MATINSIFIYKRLYRAKKPKNVFLDGISIGEEEAKTFENLTRIENSRKDLASFTR